MKVQRSISVDERLSNRVSELAAIEARSFSAMWGVLVEEALEARNGGGNVGQAMTEADLLANRVRVYDTALANVESSADALERPTTAKRTKVCVHRIPPDTFCKFGCDG